MKFSPYQTNSCSGYILEKIIQEIQAEIKMDPWASMQSLNNELGNPVRLLFTNSKFNPKPFAHPLDIVEHHGAGIDERNAVIMDIRPFTKFSPQHGMVVTNYAEHALATRRVILHSIWSTSDAYLLQNVCGSLMCIFSAWISESIVKRLDMDAITQLKIANIAAWWFWCQYNKEEDLNQTNRPKIYKLISEATRAGYDTVEADLDGLEYFDDIEGFCNTVKEATDKPSIKHLDAGALTQLTSGCWMGVHSREIMSVCIEYPPYLAAVVYSALHDRGMRSAQFTKLVQRFVTRPDIKGFKAAIDHLSKGGMGEEGVPLVGSKAYL